MSSEELYSFLCEFHNKELNEKEKFVNDFIEKYFEKNNQHEDNGMLDEFIDFVNRAKKQFRGEKMDFCELSKKELLSALNSILSSLKINTMGKDVLILDDKNTIKCLLRALSNLNYKFGMDFYDGTCSGDCDYNFEEDYINVICHDCANSIHTIKLDKLLLFLGTETDHIEPYFIIFSDVINPASFSLDSNSIYSYKNGSFIENHIEQLFLDDGSVLNTPDEINEFLSDYNNGIEDRKFNHRYIYLDKKAACIVNIQCKKMSNNISYQQLLFLHCDDDIKSIENIIINSQTTNN